MEDLPWHNLNFLEATGLPDEISHKLSPFLFENNVDFHSSEMLHSPVCSESGLMKKQLR